MGGARVNVSSLVLNAHPACDRGSGECYVQHPCPLQHDLPVSNQVCVSLLVPDTFEQSTMQTILLSRASLPKDKIIQHSHSPCVTPNYVVSKLDAFTPRNPLNSNEGMLKYVHQAEDSLWMVMHRATNTSRIMRSNAAFVVNHFWNCYEDDASGDVMIEAVAATHDYLDTYFQHNLNRDHPHWDGIFHPS